MKLAPLFASVLSLVLLAGCTDAPTAPVQAPDSEPSFSHGHYVDLTGPAEINYSGGYAFYASTHALIEPGFQWYQRYCPTSDVASCTASWAYMGSSGPYSGYNGRFTTSLTVDCTGGGTRTYQLQVYARGWLSPTVTDIHVTKLCGSIEVA